MHKKCLHVIRELEKDGLTPQQKHVLRKRKHALRRLRAKMIKGAIQVYYEHTESEITPAESNGPTATSGRRGWAVRGTSTG